MTLISCIMPTANRRCFIPGAIARFLAQDYASCELLILDDGDDAVADLIPPNPSVRYLRVPRHRTLGAKRNAACEAARGDIILHWDDDDWYGPRRVRLQVEPLEKEAAEVSGLSRVLFSNLDGSSAWEYVYPPSATPWIYGATLCYRKSIWKKHPFDDVSIGEDTRFACKLLKDRVAVLSDNTIFVGLVHRDNTSPKNTRDPRWQPRATATIRAITGGAWPQSRSTESPALNSVVHSLVQRSSDRATSSESPHASNVEANRGLTIGIGVHVGEDPDRLRETLRYLRNHTPACANILLLADGPDSAIRAALKELVGARISLTDTVAGAAACFNRLVRESDAEILIFLEAGSLVGPGWLDVLLAALAADPCHGLAGPSTNSAWNMQAVYPGVREVDIAATSAAARLRYGAAWRDCAPLHALGDFCFAVRRSVVDAVGEADTGYGNGPCWEMDYAVRAARKGFKAVWAQSAFVFRRPFTARRRRDEAALFEANRRRYQDKFCGLKLSGSWSDYAAHCRGDECPHFAPVARIAPSVKATMPPRPRPTASLPISAAAQQTPIVSCIMPTRNRPHWLRQSVNYFLRQDFAERELIIIDDGEADLSAELSADPRIRYIRAERAMSIGAKRNRACELARGRFILHWDDDDWYGSRRISAQLAPLLEGTADITALNDTCFFDVKRWQFWRCTPDLHRRLFVQNVHGGTLAYQREIFDKSSVKYPDLSLAEDAAFLHAAVKRGARLEALSASDLSVYVRHGANAWSFTCGSYLGAQGWQRVAETTALAPDRAFYMPYGPAGLGDPKSGNSLSLLSPGALRAAESKRRFGQQCPDTIPADKGAARC
jgi:glycosyltransferase involved in cell wall biosynthesis